MCPTVRSIVLLLYYCIYCCIILYYIILQKFQCSKSAITIKILFVDFARHRQGWAKVTITNHLLKPNDYFNEWMSQTFLHLKMSSSFQSQAKSTEVRTHFVMFWCDIKLQSYEVHQSLAQHQEMCLARWNLWSGHKHCTTLLYHCTGIFSCSCSCSCSCIVVAAVVVVDSVAVIEAWCVVEARC